MAEETDLKQKALEHLTTAEDCNLLALLWVAPATCQGEAWRVLVWEFANNPKTITTLRASGMLDLILNKIDRNRWGDLRNAWPHLTIGELQTVLLRAARSRKTYDWYEGDAGRITELMLPRPDCGAEEVFFILQNVPALREKLFSELMERGPAFIHLLHCLGMKEVWELAHGEILRREDWSLSPNLRQSFVTFETKHLPSAKLTELLIWQVQREILDREGLEELTSQPGYKQAAKRALKQLEA